jgi:aldehyde:ferredoxin oxidoreductase
VVDRDKFELMKNEYYELRGWDMESGLLTEKNLRDLGLTDIAGDLKKRGLLS